MADKEKIEHEWVANLRRDERWQEGRLATVRSEGAEVAALTGDLSLGGLRLAVYGLAPSPGSEVQVEVAFEDELVRLAGSVRHVSPTEWGAVVGIGFEDNGIAYLARRLIGRSRPG